MEHGRFTEWLYLSVFDELGEDEKRALDEHVLSCDECKRERDKIVRMLDAVTASGVGQPSDEALAGAQQSLRAALWKESLTQAAGQRQAAKRSFWERMLAAGRGESGGQFGGGWFRGYRPVLVGAATLCLGFFLGYVAFNGSRTALPVARDDVAPHANGRYTGISNVRFVDGNAADGKVDIIYDQVRPVRLRSGLDDERVQDVLTYALLKDDNPGVRLRAINAFGTGATAAPPPEDMKQAFLEALTTDPNAGVRLQALFVLRRLPFDDEIKETLLFVLSHDENPGLRVAAMNYLGEVAIEGSIPEKEMYNILSGKMTADDPDNRNNPARHRPVNRTEEVE
jgi:hypothetical protein